MCLPVLLVIRGGIKYIKYSNILGLKMKVTLNDRGMSDLDELCVQAIRFLSMEGVQKAKSGHPGMPMGMAAAAYTLWMKHLRHAPSDPNWINRDRFVLSAGHGSMLLYSLLHLTGYDVPLDALKNFRQMDSLTPGHPEYGKTPGVEVTTGPLGQGFSNAVGICLAQKYLAARYNREGFDDLFDYDTYVISGDGCLQEGITSEASSLAGHLGLDNLIVLYDDNHITIDGNTDLSFTEDTAKRYEAYNWYVQVVPGDGTDVAALEKALENARAEKDRPSLIQIRSIIGYSSPSFENTHTAHGAPLGDDEIALIKKNCGWDPDKSFYVPDEVYANMNKCIERGNDMKKISDDKFAAYAKKYPELAKELEDALAGKSPIDIAAKLPKFEAGSSIATRQASGKVLNELMPEMPLVLGGSADLTPSNNTWFKGAVDFQKDSRDGRYIRYGVREHAMGAIMNGIAVSGILIPYAGTFFTFSDYMKPAIRLAGLSHYPAIFVFTHDGIGVGEDGPTHQPVEQTSALRGIPNVRVFRPADANETAQTWKYMLENRDEPACILLTRQGVTVIDQDKYESAENVERGAYAVVKQDDPDVLLLATGSEVKLAMEAEVKLAEEGIKAQVVSMPCWELFEKQTQEYKDSVIPPSVKARVGVEAGVEQGWRKYIGDNGIFIGMSGFGISAPQDLCYKHFGITTEKVIEAAKKLAK